MKVKRNTQKWIEAADGPQDEAQTRRFSPDHKNIEPNELKIKWNVIKGNERVKLLVSAANPERRFPEDTKMPDPIIVPTINATALHNPT